VTAIETETGIETRIVTAIAVVAEIEIGIETVTVIAIATVIASTKTRAFTTLQITAAIDTALMPMNGAIRMACTRARTMAGAGRTTTPNVHTSTEAELRVDSTHYSPAERTVKRIATAFCAVIRKATRIGRDISSAGAFAVNP